MATVMGLLIFAFGIWGIADIFRGFGRSTVAKIGSTEIGMDQFRQLYNDRLQQIGRQIGRPLTPDQARAFGMDRQVLQQVITEAVLDETARQMGLGQSDAAVIESISNDTTFAGVNGKFDPQRFAQIIRQYGFTESRYIAEQRRVLLRREIASTLISGLEPPQALLDAKNRYDNETRTIDFVRLTEAQAGPIDTPSPEQLASYFEDNKARFRAPEYRKISFVILDPQNQAQWTDVSDDDARKIFDANKARFGTPGKRHVFQLTFPTVEEARAAREKLVAGQSFEDFAKEHGLSAGDYDLGVVTKARMLDQSVADAVFELKDNEISEPIKGQFATVIAKVTDIQPGIDPDFATAAPVIKRQIALERAGGTVRDLHNKMEDERGGGASVAEAAKKVGLQEVTLEAVDRSGRDPQGRQVAPPQGADIVAAAFASDVGTDNDPLRVGNGYVWYEVLGITPSRERTFDEVKDQVATRWHDDQVGTKLKAKSDELLDQLNKGGKKLGELAEPLGVKVETASAFKRAANAPNVSANVIDGAFRLAKGQSDRSTGDRPNEWIVYTLTDVTTPSFDPNTADSRSLRDNVLRQQGDEQIAQFIAKRQAEIGVKINQDAFAIATGAAQADYNN